MLTVAYMSFAKVITNRISETLDFNQPMEEAGFRNWYSTMVYIYIINQVYAKCSEYNLPLYVAFTGYQKGFHSAESSAVSKGLPSKCVKGAYVYALQNIYSDCAATIVLQREMNTILIRKGVRQGDAISPVLSTAFLQKVFFNLDC